MTKRLVAAYLVVVVLLAVLVPSCGRTTYPSDLEIEAFAGGFAPWTRLCMVEIGPDGGVVYSRQEPGDRSTGTWTQISSFNFTVDEMNAIWDAIEENDFFSLEQNYSTLAADGTFAVMSVTANGATHTVRTANTKVTSFDSIVKAINDATPGDLDIFYNAIHADADSLLSSIVTALQTPPPPTEVTRVGCNITVTFHIELYGPGATNEFAQLVKRDIEKWLNVGSPRAQCDLICPIRQPGCSVNFVADVCVRNATAPATPGYHQINVPHDTSADQNGHISMVKSPLPTPNGATPGQGDWDNNEPAKTYAHEAGHLAGLADQYVRQPGPDGQLGTADDTTQPSVGHESDIMASIAACNETLTQAAIDSIIAAAGVNCPCECCFD